MDHQHTMLPVGKVVDCILDEKGLLITVELSKAKFVDDIWTLCEEKILNSFSIGGIVIDGHDERGEDGKSYHVIDELAILEVSIVGLPANQNAKFQPIYKSFNSAIAEEIKKKEGKEKMPEVEKNEVVETKVEEQVEKKEEVIEKKEEIVENKTDEISKDVVVEKIGAKEEVLEKKEETKEVEKSSDTPSEEVTDNESEKKDRPYYYYYDKDGKKVGRKPYLPKAKYPETKNEDEEIIEEAGKYYPYYYYYYYDKDGNRKLGRRPYGQVKDNDNNQTQIDKQIIDLLQEILAQLKAVKEEKIEPKAEEHKKEPIEIKEEKALEVASEVKQEETVVEKKEEIEKVVEKKEEEPTRKSLAIVVPAPYEEEKEEANPKADELKKNVGWSKIIFGK